MLDDLVSEQNLLIGDVARSRSKEGRTVDSIDDVDSSGGAGIVIDDGEVLSIAGDLLSGGQSDDYEGLLVMLVVA